MAFESINKITKDDLSDSLLREIELGTTAIAGAVYKNIVSFETTVHNVDFIGGEIQSYDPVKDSIEVFLNTVKLIEGTHYTVDVDTHSITCLDPSGWVFDSQREYSPIVFEFIVIHTETDGTIKINVENLDNDVLDLINHRTILVQTRMDSWKYPLTFDQDTVYFIGGDIKYFDQECCYLRVFKDQRLLIHGVDYELHPENNTIVNISGDPWLTSSEFVFEVYTGLVYGTDGEVISQELATTRNYINQLISDIDKNKVETQFSITQLQQNLEDLSGEMTSLKFSVSNGKNLVAAAITDKGVQTAGTDSFQTMADNIISIHTDSIFPTGNVTPDKVAQGYTFSNEEGIDLVGTAPILEGNTYVPGVEDVVIDKGQFIGEPIIISGDKELVGDCIAAGHVIFRTEGTFTSDATATEYDIAPNKTAYVNGEKLTGRASTLEDSFIVPSRNNYLIHAGTFITKPVTIIGDDNLLSKNIPTGVTIFNTPGSYDSDATANPSNLLYGETAYVRGHKITGEIRSIETAEYVPTTENIVIPMGMFIAGEQTIKGDPELISENIRAGKTLFGVPGNYGAQMNYKEVTILQADTELTIECPGKIETVVIMSSTGTSTWIPDKLFSPEGEIAVIGESREVSIDRLHIDLSLVDDNTMKYTNQYGLSSIVKVLVMYL